MKKVLLKFKILLTNVSRIIYSFLFINVGNLFWKISKVDAVTLNEMKEKIDSMPVTCYAAPAPGYEIEKNLNIFERFFSNSSNVFIVLVPVVLVVLFIIYIRVKKKKDKKDDNKEEK